MWTFNESTKEYNSQIIKYTDNKKNTREWEIKIIIKYNNEKIKINLEDMKKIHDDELGNYIAAYYTVYGCENGKKTETQLNICTAKNINKANRTNRIEQVFIKAEREYNKKKNGIETEYKSPMLVEVISKCDKELYKNDEVYIQPKLNGVRLLVNDNKLYSRNKKEKTNFGDFGENVIKQLGKYKNIVFDGELYEDGEDLRIINGNVSKGELKGIIYYIFDCIMLDNIKATFKERYEFLKNIKFENPIKLIDTEYIKRSDIIKYKDDYVNNGYEGAVIRIQYGIYEPGKRSKCVMKLKDYLEDEFKIVDFECNNEKEKKALKWILVTEKGDKFSVVPKMPVEDKILLFKTFTENPNIFEAIKGQYMTVKYFDNTKKVPTQCHAIGMRRDNDIYNDKIDKYIKDLPIF